MGPIRTLTKAIRSKIDVRTGVEVRGRGSREEIADIRENGEIS